MISVPTVHSQITPINEPDVQQEALISALAQLNPHLRHDQNCVSLPTALSENCQCELAQRKSAAAAALPQVLRPSVKVTALLQLHQALVDLNPYMRHLPTCTYRLRGPSGDLCTCALTTAKSRAREALAALLESSP